MKKMSRKLALFFALAAFVVSMFPQGIMFANDAAETPCAHVCGTGEVCAGYAATCPHPEHGEGACLTPCAHVCGTADACTGNAATCPHAEHGEGACVKPCAHMCGTKEACTGNAATCLHAEHGEGECTPPPTPCVHLCGTGEACTGDGATCPHAKHDVGACSQTLLHTVRFFAAREDVAAGTPVATATVADGAALAAAAFPGAVALGLEENTAIVWRMAADDSLLLPDDTVLTYETATVVDVYAEVSQRVRGPVVRGPAPINIDGVIVTIGDTSTTARIPGAGGYTLPTNEQCCLSENANIVWKYTAPDNEIYYYLPGCKYDFDAETTLNLVEVPSNGPWIELSVKSDDVSRYNLSPSKVAKFYVINGTTVILPGADAFGSWLENFSVQVWKTKNDAEFYPGKGYNINSNGNHKLIATLGVPPIPTYKLTYNMGGQTATSGVPTPLEVAYPAQTALNAASAPTALDYVFTGWLGSDGNTYEAGQSFDMPAQDLTLTAQWTIKTYAVTFDLNGGSVPTGTSGNPYVSQTINHGSQVSQPVDPERTGYTFAGWYAGNAAWNFGNGVTGPLTLTAMWQFKPGAFSITGFNKVYDGTPASTVLSGPLMKDDEIIYTWSGGTERYVYGTDLECNFVRTNVVNESITVTIVRAGMVPYGLTNVSVVITPRPVTLTAHSGGPFLGDTTRYTVSGFDVEYSTAANPGRGLLPGHALSGVSAEAGNYLPGIYPVVFSDLSQAVVTATGSTRNLAANYSFETIEGTMEITALGGGEPPTAATSAARPAAAAPAAPSSASAGSEAPAPSGGAGQGSQNPSEGEVVIPDTPDIPLARPETTSAANWSLVNLLVAILSAALGVLLVVNLLRRNRGGEDGEPEKKRGLIWRMLAVLAGVAAPVVFLVFENLRNPMVIVNRLTAWMVLILIVQMVAMLLLKLAGYRQADEEAY